MFFLKIIIVIINNSRIENFINLLPHVFNGVKLLISFRRHCYKGSQAHTTQQNPSAMDVYTGHIRIDGGEKKLS